MQDKLYFDQLLIGGIENTDSDFPNFSGDFLLSLQPEDELSRQILNYIDFSRRQTNFYLTNEEPDEEQEEKLMEEENTFDSLISSNSWHIIDHTGHKTRILIPSFDSQNTVSWRLNSD